MRKFFKHWLLPSFFKEKRLVFRADKPGERPEEREQNEGLSEETESDEKLQEATNRVLEKLQGSDIASYAHEALASLESGLQTIEGGELTQEEVESEISAAVEGDERLNPSEKSESPAEAPVRLHNPRKPPSTPLAREFFTDIDDQEYGAVALYWKRTNEYVYNTRLLLDNPNAKEEAFYSLKASRDNAQEEISFLHSFAKTAELSPRVSLDMSRRWKWVSSVISYATKQGRELKKQLLVESPSFRKRDEEERAAYKSVGWERNESGEYEKGEYTSADKEHVTGQAIDTINALEGDAKHEYVRGEDPLERDRRIKSMPLTPEMREFLKSKSAQERAPMLKEIEATRQQLTDYLAAKGMTEDFSIIGPYPVMTHSSPNPEVKLKEKENPNDPDEWVADIGEPVYSIQWKITRIERRSYISGQYLEDNDGELSLDEYKAAREAEAELSAATLDKNGTMETRDAAREKAGQVTNNAAYQRHKQLFLEARMAESKIRDIPEGERSGLQQTLVDLRAEMRTHDVIVYQYEKGQRPGEEPGQIYERGVGYRDITKAEYEEAMVKVYDLEYSMTAVLEDLDPDKVKEIDEGITGYMRQEKFYEGGRHVNYGTLEFHVHHDAREKGGTWNMMRVGSNEYMAPERIIQGKGPNKLDERAMDHFFNFSEGGVDEIALNNDVSRVQTRMNQIGRGRAARAQRLKHMLSFMEPGPDGKMQWKEDGEVQWKKERFGEEKVTLTDQQFRIARERREKLRMHQGYDSFGGVVEMWGGHAAQLPDNVQSELGSAFAGVARKKEILVRNDEAGVNQVQEEWDRVPLGTPLQTGKYNDFDDATYAGPLSYVIPVGPDGMEVGYILIEGEGSETEYKLYGLEGSPLTDMQKFREMKTNVDEIGRPKKSAGEYLAETENLPLAVGAANIAEAARHLWDESAWSKLDQGDRDHL